MKCDGPTALRAKLRVGSGKEGSFYEIMNNDDVTTIVSNELTTVY